MNVEDYRKRWQVSQFYYTLLWLDHINAWYLFLYNTCTWWNMWIIVGNRNAPCSIGDKYACAITILCRITSAYIWVWGYEQGWNTPSSDWWHLSLSEYPLYIPIVHYHFQHNKVNIYMTRGVNSLLETYMTCMDH